MESSVSVVVSAVVTAFSVALFAAARRGKPAADAGTGELVFRHSVLLRGFSLLATFGTPIGIVALVLVVPPKNGDYTPLPLVIAMFAALTAPLLWESVRFSMAVGPDGLNCRSPWRGRQFIRWADVEQVSYNGLLGYFVIRATDGRKFRVSGLVTGLGSFLELCEKRLSVNQLQRAKDGYGAVGRPFPGGDAAS